MLPKEFKIAMFNDFGVGPFDDLACVLPGRAQDWLIIERLGKVLHISDGNIATEAADRTPCAPAPGGLSANVTLVGHHIRSTADGMESVFLLSSLSPERTMTEGLFFPSCGIVRIRQTGGQIMLTATGCDYQWGQYAPQAAGLGRVSSWNYHTQDTRAAAQKTGYGRRWAISACQRPWLGQRLPPQPATRG